MARRQTRRERSNKGSGKYDVLILPEGVEKYKSPKKAGDFAFDMFEWEMTDKHPDVILDGKDSGIDDPAVPGDMTNMLTYHVHRNVGPEGVNVICPKKTFGGKCPICEHQFKLADQFGTWKVDEVKSLFPQERIAHWIIDLNAKEEKPIVLDNAVSTFYENLERAYNKRVKKKGEFYYADVEEGFTIEGSTIEKSLGSGGSYFVFSDISFEERIDEYDESILDEITPLEEFLKVSSYKEIEALFFAEDESDEEDEAEEEEEEEKPARKSRRSARRSEAKEEEDDDDEEEEEKPVRKSRRRKSADDDEPFESGARKRRRRSSEDEDEEMPF